jgi:2,3-bisphosphoglycerate-dependent phosphoglycerate mutase
MTEMQLYFIRHAQSSNNALYDQAGGSSRRSEDPELTETGIRQAELVAEFLCRPKLAYTNNHRDPQNLGGFNLTHL